MLERSVRPRVRAFYYSAKIGIVLGTKFRSTSSIAICGYIWLHCYIRYVTLYLRALKSW